MYVLSVAPHICQKMLLTELDVGREERNNVTLPDAINLACTSAFSVEKLTIEPGS